METEKHTEVLQRCLRREFDRADEETSLTIIEIACLKRCGKDFVDELVSDFVGEFNRDPHFLNGAYQILQDFNNNFTHY